MKLGRLMAAVGVTLILSGATTMMVSCSKAEGEPPMSDAQKIERGRYLVKIGGCNDCHTPGFVIAGYDTPEKNWLIGEPLGWTGPWGTSYPANLRKTVAAYTEENFIKTMKSAKGGKGLPPMPWPALQAMTDADMSALYAYIKSLGDGGINMPAALPPGVTPTTPYLDMMPKGLPAMSAPATQTK